jgi:hypothetical protein
MHEVHDTAYDTSIVASLRTKGIVICLISVPADILYAADFF